MITTFYLFFGAEYSVTQYFHKIFGNFNQGNERFTNGGLQCTCMALECLRFSLHKDPSDWCTEDIDNILLNGNAMFNQYKGGSPRMLMVNELPRLFDFEGQLYWFNFYDEHFQYGHIVNEETVNETSTTLYDAIHKSFQVSQMVFFEAALKASKGDRSIQLESFHSSSTNDEL